jgi:oligopeptide transport system permease protein
MTADRRIRGALAVLTGLALLAVVGPLCSPWLPATLDWDHPASAPTLVAGHWFGTDTLGRDVWVRVWLGLRVSLGIALWAALVGLCIGTVTGAVAGSLGGWVDGFVMRLVDVGYAVPVVLLALLLSVVLGRGSGSLVISAATVGWLGTARMVRVQTQRLQHAPYVLAARVIGVHPARVFVRHVIPNLLGPVLVHATLTVPSLVVLESFLSFLGLGVQEPAASLGNLLHDGAREMERAPWLLLAPAALLVTALAALTVLGEGVRDRWAADE